MTASGPAALVAVDWGTTHLRIWSIATDGTVIAERRSGEGMGSTPRERFSGVLEAHLAGLGIGDGVPVLMCGMVGARQGWEEAGYLPVPASLAGLGAAAIRVRGTTRDIRILPGMSKNDPGAPDVMRSEETQLLGLARLAPAASERIVCMPGTHSKWVRMKGDDVLDFATFMTGDVFAAVSADTVLRHSVGTDPVDSASPAFGEAVAASIASPADILARLFSIRPAGLLNGLDPADARACLSGMLIGQEIAGVLARFPAPDSVDLVGGGSLGALYAEALRVAALPCTIHDGDALAIAGLTAAAQTIWQSMPADRAGTH